MFSDGEKKRRVEAVRGLMQDEKLDVLLTIGNGCVGTNAYGCFRFLTAANVYYGLQSALFFPCSNPVGIVDSEISCGELKNAGIVTECRISTTPIQAIIDVLKESEITSGRLGTSLDILPQSWRMALEREMPGLVLCDVSEPLFRIRNHHSPEEVALIRQCGKLADAGYAEVLKNVKPGMTEQQVAAELEHATQGMGADYNFTLISTGRFSLEDNQLPCIRAATMFDCVVAHGDCISMEITPRYNGYWTQLVCTISVGEPNEDFIKMHEVSCRICNGIFNHTSLCEFNQGKLLLHLTIPFEKKPKTNLPSDNLKYYRQRKQMTTRQLAEKLDIVPATVVLYESGKHPIPYDVAIKLADVLKIEAALFYDDFSRFLAVPYTEALKSVRMALGLSQKAFAEQIEVIPSYYYKLEEGNRRPSRKVYQKICAVLEATGRQTSLLWEQPLQ